MQRAFVALGSNLMNPVVQIQSAILAIDHIPKTQVRKKSSLYKTSPIDCPQMSSEPVPDFINAVVEVETSISPELLLQALHEIENQAGRKRSYVNAPRVLDCDLLLYEGVMQHTDKLTLPHPRMHERGFVLLPLAEIAPQLSMPTHGKIAQLITPNLTQNIEKL